MNPLPIVRLSVIVRRPGDGGHRVPLSGNGFSPSRPPAPPCGSAAHPALASPRRRSNAPFRCAPRRVTWPSPSLGPRRICRSSKFAPKAFWFIGLSRPCTSGQSLAWRNRTDALVSSLQLERLRPNGFRPARKNCYLGATGRVESIKGQVYLGWIFSTWLDGRALAAWRAGLGVKPSVAPLGRRRRLYRAESGGPCCWPPMAIFDSSRTWGRSALWPARGWPLPLSRG